MTLHAKWVEVTEPTEPTKPTESSTSTEQSSPQTGDDSNIAWWSKMLLISTAMIGMLSRVAFKKKYKSS